MVLVTGATGFLGKRVVKKLIENNIKHTATSLSTGHDLTNISSTFRLFKEVQPEFVINCSAYVGGIQYGYDYPVELFRANLLMSINILEACDKFKVKKLINPISNCAYPARAELFKEEEFWDGELHESVMVYGLTRKALCVGAWAYQQQKKLNSLNLIFPNMYGPGDHFEEKRSHAMGALIMKIVEAERKSIESVVIWGTGKPIREWMYVDDAANALIHGLTAQKITEPINIGVGKGISIYEMAIIIKDLAGYKGNLILDTSKPDGAAVKIMDANKADKLLNFKAQTSLYHGIGQTIEWYKKWK